MKSSIKSIATAALIAVLASSAQAVTYTGDISVANSTLVLGGGWSNVTSGILSWSINDTANAGKWTYNYSFNLPGFSPDISHAIIEVTAGAALSDFQTTGGGTGNSVDTFSSANPSNPGLLGPIYGLKVNTPENSNEPFLWSVITTRAPVWHDFYAKGGSDSFAHNSGFLAADPVSAPTNGSLNGHILSPNGSTTVPDGGLTVALLGLGLAALAAGRRFFQKL